MHVIGWLQFLKDKGSPVVKASILKLTLFSIMNQQWSVVSDTVYMFSRCTIRVGNVPLHLWTAIFIHSLTSFPQVVELLGSILERPIIQAEYTNCLPHLIHLLKQEIETAKVSWLYLFSNKHLYSLRSSL